jgi:hypothetical protein
MKIRAWKAVSLLAVSAFAISFFPGSAAAETKLLAQWKFNENSADATGNGHDATLKNKAVYAVDAVEGSHSLLLEGTAYASVAAFDLGDAFTITLWAYLLPEQTDIKTLVANCEGGSRINGFKLYVNSWETNDRKILVEPSDGTDRIDITSLENTFEEALWNHFAIAADRVNGIIDLYLNGEKVNQTSQTITGFQTTRSLFIGTMPPGNVYNWQGMIDDVRVYEGVLSEDEISATMNPETAVEEPSRAAQPGGFRLMQNHPNPFNPSTAVSYFLPQPGPVSLKVFDQRGRVAAVLEEGVRSAGTHETSFTPDGLAAGIYYCRLQAGTFSQTVKMLYVK